MRLYSIGAASAKLGVHPRTLMAWERIGLVKPARRSTRRHYSDDELRWLECVQAFNREGGVSLKGLSTLLRFVPCWAIRGQIQSGEGVCCPPAYPAKQSLDRVRGAYAGSAPRECRSCGVYLSNVEPCGAALER
jgi:MerR family transcriptional regulator/heat shock protein HspR